MIKSKEGSSTFLLKVYDTDEDFIRCNYAIVTITKDLMDVISKLRKGRDEMKCYEVTEFQYACEFLAQDEFEDEMISDELVDELEDFTQDNSGVWQIEPIEDVVTLRTDADTIHVSDYGIKWTTYGKFSGVRFSTERISWDLLDNLNL
jgi:hypothetical protein